MGNSHSRCSINRVADSGRNRQDATFAHAFRAVGTRTPAAFRNERRERFREIAEFG